MNKTVDATRYPWNSMCNFSCFDVRFLISLVVEHQISGASPLRSAKICQLVSNSKRSTIKSSLTI
jgi:hypothetical protein